MTSNNFTWIRRFKEISIDDIASVGGKNASLGEMYSQLSRQGIRVPDGFAVTADAYREFLRHNNLENRITNVLQCLDKGDLAVLHKVAGDIRDWINAGTLPGSVADEITAAYLELEQQYGAAVDVAVRSSATAEDLPGASFAGQQETRLHVRGIDHLLETYKQILASLFTDRAISYRVDKGFDHAAVALSVGIQKMVRADKGASGVIFTLDTESGFRDVVLVTASYGLGEPVVSGAVDPDEFLVFKPTLMQGNAPIVRRSLGSKHIKMVYGETPDGERSTRIVEVDAGARDRFAICDADVLQLARMAVAIENYYSEQAGHPQPMDIEWASDGELYIVQARPETVHAVHPTLQQKTWKLKSRGNVRVLGRSIGNRISTGLVRIINDAGSMGDIQTGEVLVTDTTDPDWEPVMKKAAAIVTNRGSRVCHAAIIARELGIPAVVGTGNATGVLRDGDVVTVSCAEGEEGYVYEGKLDFEVEQQDVGELARPAHTRVLLNISNPGHAFDWAALPNDGVGLVRLEFLIANSIGVHPAALLDCDRQTPDLRQLIAHKSRGYPSPRDFYIDRLAEGIGTIAAAFYPKPVSVRLSDFKSNEYAALPGGAGYEPREENPMLGLRGAARYYSEQFRDSFSLECRALGKVRREMGLFNIRIIIPFVRTVDELDRVMELMGTHGLVRGEDNLEVYVMCELPANVIRAEEFLQRCDGFSIGSNDLTQLILGVDRDSSLPGNFDERDPAVMELMKQAIAACQKENKYVGICGQAPSDFPSMTRWLVGQGIDSISVNQDALLHMTRLVLATEDDIQSTTRHKN